MTRDEGRAPARRKKADDQQIAVEHAAHRAPAETRDPPDFLRGRAFPKHLAAGIEGDHHALDAVGVNVARRRVADKTRPAHAVVRNIGLEDVEPVFPNLLPAIRVQADDLFLPAGRVVRLREPDHADALVEDDRSRAAAVRRLPQQILAVGRPCFGQSALAGDAVGIQSPPIRPLGALQSLRPKSGPPAGKREHEGRRRAANGERRAKICGVCAAGR